MVKIKFEEPRNPKKYPQTNLYMTSYGLLACFSLYEAKTIINPETIIIIKQNNLLRTLYLLTHELGHWAIENIFGRKSLKVHKLYDNIDRRIVKL